jgi:NAD(P)-dependent dehydrogenase (short-subunit alcohol dehydrogenase family)
VIIKGQKVLVLGGYGLVGTAVCRQILSREPEEIILHSLREEEAEEARRDLLPEAGGTRLSLASGDILGLEGEFSQLEQIAAQISALEDDKLINYRLYNLLADNRPDIVIDCVNTATAIAYRNVYQASQQVLDDLQDGVVDPEHAAHLLESQYIPRLIRHMQILYRGMISPTLIQKRSRAAS